MAENLRPPPEQRNPRLRCCPLPGTARRLLLTRRELGVPQRSPDPKGIAMRGKQIAITAVIALVVVVGFNTYQAKKAG